MSDQPKNQGFRAFSSDELIWRLDERTVSIQQTLEKLSQTLKETQAEGS